MRFALILAACAHPAPPPAPPIANASAHSCGEAANRLEDATRALRAPEVSINKAMRERCASDHWSAAAIDCFSGMTPDELGACASKLPPESQKALFEAFGDGIAGSVARLKQLHVNIPACDKLIGAFVTVLTCDRVAFDQRVELGNETADFWQLPDKLPPDATARMASACEQSFVELRARVGESGCMP